MLRWQIEKKILELKYDWKISRNTSREKINLIVRVSDHMHEGMGEAAPNIRYNESPDKSEKEFETFISSEIKIAADIFSFADQLKEINLSHSLRFAIESAYAHFLCRKNNCSIFDLLKIPVPQNIFTSYSIPIMDPGEMKNFFDANNLSRFSMMKIKINEESGKEMVNAFAKISSQPFIIDANEAWTDVEQLIYFLEGIKKYPVVFVEQPMPAGMNEEMIYLKKYSAQKLFADESVTDEANFEEIKKMFDGVNIKLMKAGGYVNAIKLLREAKSCGLQTMIGCMVETTLGIYSGMNLCGLADFADLDSFMLVRNEPFHLVEEKKGELFFSSPAK